MFLSDVFFAGRIWAQLVSMATIPFFMPVPVRHTPHLEAPPYTRDIVLAFQPSVYTSLSPLAQIQPKRPHQGFLKIRMSTSERRAMCCGGDHWGSWTTRQVECVCSRSKLYFSNKSWPAARCLRCLSDFLQVGGSWICSHCSSKTIVWLSQEGPVEQEFSALTSRRTILSGG